MVTLLSERTPICWLAECLVTRGSDLKTCSASASGLRFLPCSSTAPWRRAVALPRVSSKPLHQISILLLLAHQKKKKPLKILWKMYMKDQRSNLFFSIYFIPSKYERVSMACHDHIHCTYITHDNCMWVLNRFS